MCSEVDNIKQPLFSPKWVLYLILILYWILILLMHADFYHLVDIFLQIIAVQYIICHYPESYQPKRFLQQRVLKSLGPDFDCSDESSEPVHMTWHAQRAEINVKKSNITYLYLLLASFKDPTIVCAFEICRVSHVTTCRRLLAFQSSSELKLVLGQ